MLPVKAVPSTWPSQAQKRYVTHTHDHTDSCVQSHSNGLAWFLHGKPLYFLYLALFYELLFTIPFFKTPLRTTLLSVLTFCLNLSDSGAPLCSLLHFSDLYNTALFNCPLLYWFLLHAQWMHRDHSPLLLGELLLDPTTHHDLLRHFLFC